MTLSSVLKKQRNHPINWEQKTSSHKIQIIGSQHPRRREVEAFIAERYLKTHEAVISNFMPELIIMTGKNHCLRAAAGIRGASGNALFLEYYLDNSIEQAIAESAAHTDPNTQRERIVEIGNLASIDRGASINLFYDLAILLSERRYQWAVFTGCHSLHRMFQALGIETIELAQASQTKLPAEQQTWGDYYQNRPSVVAGRIDDGYLALRAATELRKKRCAA